jgi:hypothetical protein
LHIRFTGVGYSHGVGFDNVLLPKNATAQVQINAVGVSIEVLLNGTVTQHMTLPAARTTGPAVLYISDPWHPPANATIANVKMVPISSLTPFLTFETPLIETPILLFPRHLGKVNIPNDFSLSFNLNPKGIISESGSIIRFTGNGISVSQLPAIRFLPNTNSLHIRFSGVEYWDLGFTNVLLPTNAKTHIQVNAGGVSIELLLNGTVTQYMALPRARTTGPAVLDISDPWLPPANATISNVSLLPIPISLETPLIETPTLISPRLLGKVYVPANYSLSSDIKLVGTKGHFGSILAFSNILLIRFFWGGPDLNIGFVVSHTQTQVSKGSPFRSMLQPM